MSITNQSLDVTPDAVNNGAPTTHRSSHKKPTGSGHGTTSRKKTVTSDKVTDPVKTVTKQKRKRQDLTDMFTPHCAPGEVSTMMTHAYEMSHWPPFDSDDPQQVIDRIDMFHRYCIANDVKPDMAGLALAMGVSRKTLWCWENGVDSNKPQAVRNALKRGRDTNEFILSQMMQMGKINPIPAIFLLKNNHEYKDQQDVVITPNTPLQQLDDSEAQQKILDALPDVTD